jgi:hypothetical protein
MLKNTNETVTTAGSLVDGFDQIEQIVENNSLNKLIQTQTLKRVSDEIRQKIKNFYSGPETEKFLKNTYKDSDGNLCFIKLTEIEGPSITFENLWNLYGPGKTYDPAAPQQRRDKQHGASDRKEILLSFIGGENLGNFILLETADGRFWIIDGRQRSSIVNEFLTGKMKLTGTQANNFWKWFLNDQFLYSDNLTSEDKLASNKIIKSFENGTTPRVEFTKLPSVIRNYIFHRISIQTVIIKPSVFKFGEVYTKVDESKWDYEEIMSSVTRKFIDINMYHKAIDKKDILWGAKSDSIRLVRDFLEEKPAIGLKLGYNLVDKEENGFFRLDDTTEVRKLLILISRACMIFQDTVKWGATEGEITKLILKSDDHDFESKTKEVWRAWKVIVNNKLMTKPYFDQGKQKYLYIPEEFSQGQRDVLVLAYILTTLYLVDYMMEDGYGIKNGYFFNQEPADKLYKLLEKISLYLLYGKLANINHENWNDDKYILKKYNLFEEFQSEEKFDGVEIQELMRKVKDLNQHQKGLAVDYKDTFTKLIRYTETKI